MRKLLQNSFFKSATAYLSGNVLQQLTAVILLPLWALFLTPADYMVTGAVTAIGMVVTYFCTMGLNSSVSREYVEMRSREGDWRNYYGTIYLTQLFGSLVWIALFYLAGLLCWPVLTGNRIPTHPYLELTLIGWALYAMSTVPTAVLQMEQQVWRYIRVQYLRFFTNAAVGLFLVGYCSLGALGVLWATLISNLAAAMLASWEWRRVAYPFTFVREAIQPALRFGLPMVPHLLGCWGLDAMSRIMIVRYDSEQNAGLFAFAFTLGAVMHSFSGGLNQAWVPKYMQLMKDGPAKQPTIRKYTGLYLAALSGIAAIGMLFAPELVRLLFKQRYWPSVALFLPVLLALLCNAYYYLSSSVLFYHKKQGLLPVITGICAGFNFAANLLVMPRFGAEGAVFVTLATYLLMFLLAHGWAGRFSGAAYRIIDAAFMLIVLAAIMCWIRLWPDVSLAFFLLKLCVLAGVLGLAYLLFLRRELSLSLPDSVSVPQ